MSTNQAKRIGLVAGMGFPILFALTGCQSPAPVGTGAGTASAVPLPSGRAPTPDEAVASDASAARLHDIVGALLNYYIHNGNRLPDTLDQIKPYGDLGTELNFTSPSSGQPYVYLPGGLMAAGQDKRIIVWDPQPDKKGFRWCILMPHMDPTTAIVPEVDPISEPVFEQFVPPIQ